LFRPIDIIRCFHNAFRRDVSEIDASVIEIAHSGADLEPVFNRLKILGEILDYHARGEEIAVFPAIDKLAPLVSNAYLIDHRELDLMVNGLETIHKTPDLMTTARATAVLQSQLRIHLDKEDVHLYPILRERTTDEEQITIAQVMSSKIPPDQFPVLTHWLFPLLDLNDQVIVTRGWMSVMPSPVFSKAKVLIKKNVAENWAKISEQIPKLE
jgi:iron-sulfur cluster repair protein YtfE (RIC family)